MTIRRICIDPVQPAADNNIKRHYPIQDAAWIWHPERRFTDEPTVLRFRRQFALDFDCTFQLHVSADERYELWLDGELISRGPDRCDLFHWSFASCAVTLPAGEHELVARVWRLGEAHRPIAQMTNEQGGFILAADNGLENVLNTGTGDWQVAVEEGWSFGGALPGSYHVIGSSMTLDAAAYRRPSCEVAPVVVRPPVWSNRSGLMHPGWRLYPTSLPEQIWSPRRSGQIRAVAQPGNTYDEGDQGNRADWQALLTSEKAVTVASNSRLRVLWDLEDYVCGYPCLRVSGGEGATIHVAWAESLFEDLDDDVPRNKGNRNDIAGKRFFGFGDTLCCDGESVAFRPLWWRSGRYLQLEIAVAGAPLTLEALHVIETRYPVENDGRWSASDDDMATIEQIAVRGIQMCSHETYMDCPYYEQLMYVGDTRLEMLTTYVMTTDSRLAKRGMELYDWSRHSTGFVNERYPSTPQQLSLTFSLIWVTMVRDFAWWRDEPAWVKARLLGVRALLDQFLPLLNDNGLLEGLPGWSFVDWVPAWPRGTAKGVEVGQSSIVNLFYVLALQSAAELEDSVGEGLMAQRYRAKAESVQDAVRRHFWNNERGLLADDTGHEDHSEHAQCLALLTDTLAPGQRDRCFQQLLAAEDLHRATVYFSYYLFEVLYRFDRGDLLMAKLDFWRDLAAQGFYTPVEAPEPSRSDCHAWGSHPLHHFYASLAGIRPAGPGFATVTVAPSPGGLTHIDCSLPHPSGAIDVALKFGGGFPAGSITLPEGVSGQFVWQGEERALTSGANELQG